MKIIGNREALELAKKKLGSKAMIARTKTMFFVGLRLTRSWWHVKGEGRSWSDALRNAGVEIPNEINCANVPTPADVEKLAGGGE